MENDIVLTEVFMPLDGIENPKVSSVSKRPLYYYAVTAVRNEKDITVSGREIILKNGVSTTLGDAVLVLNTTEMRFNNGYNKEIHLDKNSSDKKVQEAVVALRKDANNHFGYKLNTNVMPLSRAGVVDYYLNWQKSRQTHDDGTVKPFRKLSVLKNRTRFYPIKDDIPNHYFMVTLGMTERFLVDSRKQVNDFTMLTSEVIIKDMDIAEDRYIHFNKYHGETYDKGISDTAVNMECIETTDLSEVRFNSFKNHFLENSYRGRVGAYLDRLNKPFSENFIGYEELIQNLFEQEKERQSELVGEMFIPMKDKLPNHYYHVQTFKNGGQYSYKGDEIVVSYASKDADNNIFLKTEPVLTTGDNLRMRKVLNNKTTALLQDYALDLSDREAYRVAVSINKHMDIEPAIDREEVFCRFSNIHTHNDTNTVIRVSDTARREPKRELAVPDFKQKSPDRSGR